MTSYPGEIQVDRQGLSAMANEAYILAEKLESKAASNRVNLHGSWAEVSEGPSKPPTSVAPTNLESILHLMIQTLRSAEQHLDYALNNF